jgi:DNA-binding CsgD family transcriptional regulator
MPPMFPSLGPELEKLAMSKRPDQIIESLQRFAVHLGVNFYGAWRIPHRPQDYWRGYPVGKSMFLDPEVGAHYAKHIAMAREHGPNVLARMAWVSRVPFTITECLRQRRPGESERWVFNLLREYGIRDGFYCPINNWIVLFWAPKVLRLSLARRGRLFALAMQAAMRLDQIVPPPREERVRLSARELAVLQHLSHGASDAKIARALGIGETTIRTYVARAMTKLGANTREHACCEAMRRMLLK